MKIINEDDPRYNLLDNMWEAYDKEDLVIELGARATRYLIPEQLVINNYVTSKTKVLSTKPDMSPDSEDNLVNDHSIKRVLVKTCELSLQDYYDLCFLKINDTRDRPKCPYCGYSCEFSGKISRGYKQFCSRSCARTFELKNRELYPKVAEQFDNFNQLGTEARLSLANNTFNCIKKARSQFLSYGSANDSCQLYCVHNGYKVKFGVSGSIESRLTTHRHVGLTFQHILLVSNRVEIANIEAKLKLKLGDEEIEFLDLPLLFKYLKEILSSRPVESPFD